ILSSHHDPVGNKVGAFLNYFLDLFPTGLGQQRPARGVRKSNAEIIGYTGNGAVKGGDGFRERLVLGQALLNAGIDLFVSNEFSGYLAAYLEAQPLEHLGRQRYL